MGSEDWDRLHQDLASHERDRETLGYAGAPALAELPALRRYEVLARLGEGATSVVYRAKDRDLQRLVALKVQRHAVALSDVGRERFRREAQTAASLSHPNLVTLHDAGEERGQCYLVMELVDGRPLSQLLAGKTHDLRSLLTLLEKAARGVAAAHEKGIVHRDLKPSNILVTAGGEPKVGDFGLAHLVDSTSELTRTGSSVGTPLYMSPEQVEGRAREITPRTDVYSLGAILYEILTGRPPHLGETMMEIYKKIVHEEAAAPRRLNPKLPADLETIALKALEKDPTRRYPTALAFAEDLGRFLAGEPVLARPAPAYRLYRRFRKSLAFRVLSVAAAAAFLAAIAIAIAAQGEREKRLDLLRRSARTSLDAVLQLRRAGANHSIKGFVPELESAYRQALESAPDSAEVESLMGRLHRALMDDEKALEFQERALRKDPSYAPALYERAVLLANRYGSGLTKAVAEARKLPPGPVTAEAARRVPLPVPQDVEGAREELLAVREAVLRDCTALERLTARGPAQGIREAHILTVKGLLACYRLEFSEARTLLADAVQKDPTLEEAWAALCEAAYRQSNLRARRSADLSEIRRLYQETEELHTQAISNDAGYVPHWIGRADTRRHLAFYLMSRGENALGAFNDAEADLTHALRLTQDFPDAWLLRATVRQLKAVCLMDLSQDATRELDAATDDLRVVLSRWGDRPSAWLLKSHLHNERARAARRAGRDPLPDYAAAEEAARRAAELDPSDSSAASAAGSSRMSRAEYQIRHGVDPLPDYAEAEKDFTEALRRARHIVEPWDRRGQLRQLRGEYRVRKGQLPVDDFVQAEEDFTEALRIQPSSASLLSHRAGVRADLARAREKAGRPPEAVRAYGEAIADYKRAFELNASLKASYGGDVTRLEAAMAALQSGR